MSLSQQRNSGHVNVPKFCSNKLAWLLATQVERLCGLYQCVTELMYDSRRLIDFADSATFLVKVFEEI